MFVFLVPKFVKAVKAILCVVVLSIKQYWFAHHQPFLVVASGPKSDVSKKERQLKQKSL